MPMCLPPISRRQFIRHALAAGAGLTAFRHSFAASGGADTRWALFSDTHIAESLDTVAREVNMAAHLRAAITEVLGLADKPAGVLVNGDCAYLKGLEGDYTSFAGLIKPLSDAGLPVHLTLGNHDDRDNIRKGVVAAVGASPMEGRRVSIIETSRANWVLLDSLDKVNSTPGRLDAEQRAWLAAALDARKDKPALVMVHHNPQAVPAGDTTTKITGLVDTAELFDLLLPRKQVKALFYGHSHVWSIKEREGLHLVNLPAVAYVFAKTQPSGWVDCRLESGGMALELRSLDPAHPEHGRKTELVWRA